MKLTINVLAAIVAICVWYGCKKEKDPTPELSKTPTCRVKMVRNDDYQPPRSISYEYDASGKITKSINQDGSYATYEYSGDRLIIKEYTNLDQPIKPSPELTLYLNSQGYIVKEIRKFSQFVSDTIDYNYSSDGFLLTETWHGKSSSTLKSETTMYTVENGNTTKMETVSVEISKTVVYTDIFTFLSETNKGGIYQRLSGDNRPINRFYGLPNKNLINTQTSTDGNKTYITQYHYDMKDGLPSYSYVSQSGSSDYFKRKYEFDCK